MTLGDLNNFSTTQRSGKNSLNVIAGRVGWSNKRNGCEFYFEDPNNVNTGRWDGQDDWGDLLAYHLDKAGIGEGDYVAVIACDRFHRLQVNNQRNTVTVKVIDPNDPFVSMSTGTALGYPDVLFDEDNFPCYVRCDKVRSRAQAFRVFRDLTDQDCFEEIFGNLGKGELRKYLRNLQKVALKQCEGAEYWGELIADDVPSDAVWFWDFRWQ